MRVLLIDDSRVMRRILANYLEGQGFEFVEAGDGQEALHCMTQHHPIHCALVDWNMPVMNGLDFVKAVRADPCYNETRLVMVTTENDEIHVRQAIEAGADEYVMKPITREMLLEKLQMLGVMEAQL